MAGMAYDLETATRIMWSIPRVQIKNTDPRCTAHIPPDPGAWAKVATYQRGHDIHKWRANVRTIRCLNKTRRKTATLVFNKDSLTSSSASEPDKSKGYTQSTLFNGWPSSNSSSVDDFAADGIISTVECDGSIASDEEHDKPTHFQKGISRTQQLYYEIAEKYGVPTLIAVYRQLDTYHMDLKRARITRGEFKAIATTLCFTPWLVRLNLTECMLDGVKVSYLCGVLRECVSITDVILTDNQLGWRLLNCIIKCVMDLDNVVYLDITGNDAKDDGAKILAEYIGGSALLQYLTMQNNNFGPRAGIMFGQAIRQNNCLTYLNLSWNQLRKDGAYAFLQGCTENNCLESLDVSWNGLRSEGSTGIRNLLTRNSSLTSLNVAGTGLDSAGIEDIIVGLENNSKLQRLEINHNPLLLEDFTELLQSIYNMPNTGIKHIHLGDQTLYMSAVAIIDHLLWEKNIAVKYGSIIGTSDSSTVDQGIFSRFMQDDGALPHVMKLSGENRMALIKHFKELDSQKVKEEQSQMTPFLVATSNEDKDGTTIYKHLAARIGQEDGHPKEIIDSIIEENQKKGDNQKRRLSQLKHATTMAEMRDLQLKVNYGNDYGCSEDEDKSRKLVTFEDKNEGSSSQSLLSD